MHEAVKKAQEDPWTPIPSTDIQVSKVEVAKIN